MSNNEIIELAEINVEEHQVREVLRCIIHTIIFNRALGHVSPRDRDLQLINISYVEVADEDVEKRVEEGLKRIEAFVKSNQSRPTNSSNPKAYIDGVPFVVRLSFYELVSKSGFSSTYQEKVYWESWRIRFKVVTANQSSAERAARQQQVERDVDNMRTIILHNADSKKGHIPPIKPGSPGAMTYPFDIEPERQTWLWDSVLSRTLNRLLSGQSAGQPGVLK